MIATDLANLGEAHHLSGALDRASPLYEEALALFESISDPGGRGFVLTLMGRLASDRKEHALAQTLLTESLQLLWSAGERGTAADALEALGDAEYQLGQADTAATLLQAADALRAETGVARQPAYADRYQQLRQAVGDQIGALGHSEVDATVEKVLSQSSVSLALTN
jgi:tetratricopeptide (TPR) repeat protein